MTAALLAGLVPASRQDLREGKIKNGTIRYLFFIGSFPLAASFLKAVSGHMMILRILLSKCLPGLFTPAGVKAGNFLTLLWMQSTSCQISPRMRILGLLAVSFPMLLISMIRPGAFGGGDIKLMAACGMILGAEGILVAASIGLCLAGGFCLAGLITGRLDRKCRLAIGPFLSIGVLMSWLLYMGLPKK